MAPLAGPDRRRPPAVLDAELPAAAGALAALQVRGADRDLRRVPGNDRHRRGRARGEVRSVKERPIIMTAESVRAIRAGHKSQTRRLVKSPHVEDAAIWAFDEKRGTWESGLANGAPGSYGHGEYVRCPYGLVGDRLWVKETWQTFDAHANGEDVLAVGEARLRGGKRSPIDGVSGERAIEWTAVYRADGEVEHPELGGARWRSPLHMPRWASRIALTVTALRIERLHAISEADARAEGVRCHPFTPDDGFPVCDGYMFGPDDGKSTLYPTAVRAYEAAWESINGKSSPLSDPWVWVVTFEVAP